MATDLVAIPLYNEFPTFSCVFDELRRWYQGEVLLVDDGSTDGTEKLIDARASSNVHVIRHVSNRGYGQSLIDAFGFALRGKYRTLVTIDGDAQHQPCRVRKLLDEIGETDILSGSRYLEEFPENSPSPMERRGINARITEHVNRATGYKLTDAFCGLKAYRVAALEPLRLIEPSYGFPLQLWIQAARYGLTVREMAIPRIYLPVTRTFGAELDNPEVRFAYYERIIEEEVRAWRGES